MSIWPDIDVHVLDQGIGIPDLDVAFMNAGIDVEDLANDIVRAVYHHQNARN